MEEDLPIMRVVCAVDGSEHSQWGIQALEALASREPEQVTLLHVVDKPALQALAGRNPVAGRRVLAAMEKAGRMLLRNAARSARMALGQAVTAPHTTIQTTLAYGSSAKTITREAGRSKADLILIGSRGLSDLQGFLLGSISRHVASIAPCSVWVVKQPLHVLSRVTLAVDDSAPSRAAARFLRSSFLPETATVTILSAVESPVTDLAGRYLSESQVAELTNPAMEQATAFVNSLRNDFIKDGFPVVTQVQMGHVIDTIVKHVEAHRDDLLVIGARKLTKSERLYLGSVSESLLRHAPCSVLIVRDAHA
jgi:nucleotide-binding universal stress UspA family protein